MRKRSTNAIAGVMFYLASVIALMGIITAEIFYPTGYSTRSNEISDLGATRPPNSVSYQPSATIFNISMIIVGILVLVGVFYLFKTKHNRFAKIFLLLFGVGVLAVGIFPGNTGTPHVLAAMLTFLSGGIAAVVASRTMTGFYKFISFLLGITALVFWFFAGSFIPLFGPGGTERYIAYPILLWLAGYGGYLLGLDFRASTEATK